MMDKPCFLITIDTEGDNAWGRPRVATTKNARYLERFQDMCESNGLKPTYLTNWEMVMCPVFRGFAGWILARDVGEIGMHLHAWNTPPLVPLTPDDLRHLPYLVEYPESVMREKIRKMTGALEDAFGVKMVSHRAGRWSFDERYANLLIEEGYRVDCSVTPLVSWARTKGDPLQGGGTDYEAFPQDAYWVDPEDISQAGTSPLLEVPMTILPGERTEARSLAEALRRLPGPLPTLTDPLRRVCDRVTPPVRWLRPNGRNGLQLLEIVEEVLAQGRLYAEFMLHSSEFMPGGSPTFQTEADIERLFNDLSVLFSAVRGRFRGATLAEFHAVVVSQQTTEVGAT
jgi:hypothetical protein